MKWKINNKKRFINFYFYIIKLFYSKGLLLLRFFLLISLFFTSLIAKDERTNILILNSFHETLPWVLEVNKGLKEANKKYNDSIRYYTVNFDYIRIQDQLTPQEWKKYINKKYENIKFDGIFANSTYAIKMLGKFGDDFMPNIPRVYNDYGANPKHDYELNLALDRENTVKKTMELILKLHPNIKNLYTIDGFWKDTYYLKKLLPQILKNQPQIKHTSFNILEYSYDEILEILKDTKENSVLIATVFDRDKTGKKMSPIDFMRMFTKNNSHLPIYSFLTTSLETNIVGGGHMLNGTINAKTVVDAIMDYKKNGKYTVAHKDSMKSYVKWEAVKKFNINHFDIPSDVIILNKPKSVFESYYYEAISTAIFIFFLILILICLLYLVYKLKDTNIKLQMETEEKIEKEKLLTQQTKTALMGEMISNIAHQWRQPLNRINSNIAVIDIQNMRLDINDEKIENSLQNIEKQTHYMSQTIDDFFQFISDDKEKEDFYLIRPINRALELLSTRLVNIKVEINIDESIKINSYENEFAQVILSLINNSLDIFKINKLGAPAISIDVKKVEDKIFIEISDNGGGIKDEIIHKIFDANFSTKTNTKASGLGLYISKNIIENSMKGSIEAFNNEQGASFKITLKA